MLANGKHSHMFGLLLHAEKKLMVPFILQTMSSEAIEASGADEFDFQAVSGKQLVVQEEKGKGMCFDGDTADQGKFMFVGGANKIFNVHLSMKQ